MATQASKRKSKAPVFEQGVLVSVPMGVASMSKVDKELSQAVADDREANASRIRTSKQLVDSPDLKAMKKIMGQVRNNTIKEMTLPWGEQGQKYLPIELKDKFDAEIADQMSQFFKYKEQFIASYDELIAQAKRKAEGLGNAFNASDYPSKAELDEKFHFSVEYSVLLDPADARVKLSEAARKRLIKEAEESIANRTAKANESVIERTLEVLGHLAEKLATREVDDKGKVVTTFRDNTLTKAQRLAEALPALNLTGNKALQDAANDMISTLHGIDAKTLRGDNAKCKQLANEVAKITDNLKGAIS